MTIHSIIFILLVCLGVARHSRLSSLFMPFLFAVVLAVGLAGCDNDDNMVDDGGDEISCPDQYAVLVHGSKGFYYYRHLADVLNVYQLLRKNGFDDDHIILIIDCALANDSLNKEPGIIRISPEGQDLLGGTDGLPKAEVDYDAADLTPADISDIIQNVGSKGHNVLLYWSGHGSRGYFSWRDTKEGFTADRLRQTVEAMTFRKLFVVTETCRGESVISSLEGLRGVLAMSSAASKEDSYADNWNASMQVWMCDQFTKNMVDFLSANPPCTFNELYDYTREHTVNSHVQLVNADCFGDLSTESPAEFFTKQ